MIKRIVEVGTPARLTIKHKQMVIKHDGVESASVPIEDLGILILDHLAITQSTGLLSACLKNNVAVVACDNKHLPNSMFLSFNGNSLQTKTISKQIQIKMPLRKKLWQAIIKAKIGEQAKVLNKTKGDSHPLSTLITRVKSGDSSNVESLAARLYWQKLFGQDFQRARERAGINSLLNYGYTVIRAAVARAIVSTGLHPSLGLHHHNQYNNFCLADDLMEPLRPAVDMTVYQIIHDTDNEPDVTPEFKKSFLEILNKEFYINTRKFPLLVSLHYYAASLRKVICDESKKLEIPYL